jgi:hypothetical protein
VEENIDISDKRPHKRQDLECRRDLNDSKCFSMSIRELLLCSQPKDEHDRIVNGGKDRGYLI